MTENHPDEILSLKEVECLLKLSRHSIERAIRKGLPACKVGGMWRFRRSRVLEWLDQSKREAH